MKRIHAQISRLEPLTGGWLLAFYGPRSTKVIFEEARLAVSALPIGQRKYIPSLRAWWLSHDALLGLCPAWPQLAEELARVRGEDAPPPPGADARHSGDRVRPMLPQQVAEAFKILCLTPEAPPEVVSAARRAWSRLEHPDHHSAKRGGDEATRRMAQINIAADRCLKFLEQHAAREAAHV